MNHISRLKLWKRKIESAAGIRVFRKSSVPRGTDLYIDLADVLDLAEFKVIYDVGANVGQSALEYAERFPAAKIYSFEPVSFTYERLAATTRHLSRVHRFQAAMGREAGELVINVDPETVGSSIVNKTSGGAEKVSVTTAALFSSRNQIGKIDFMKIDTEGYDLEVLAGAAPLLREQRIRFVMVECEPLPITRYFVSFCAIAEFMQSYPYKMFAIYRQQAQWDGRKSLQFFNAVFICNELGD